MPFKTKCYLTVASVRTPSASHNICIIGDLLYSVGEIMMVCHFSHLNYCNFGASPIFRHTQPSWLNGKTSHYAPFHHWEETRHPLTNQNLMKSETERMPVHTCSPGCSGFLKKLHKSATWRAGKSSESSFMICHVSGRPIIIISVYISMYHYLLVISPLDLINSHGKNPSDLHQPPGPGGNPGEDTPGFPAPERTPPVSRCLRVAELLDGHLVQAAGGDALIMQINYIS